MRLALRTAAAVCALLQSAAQTSPPRPQFEVASVKAAPADGPAAAHLPMMREMMRAGRRPGAIPLEDPGRLRLENWALLDLIAAAFSVPASRVSGPSWMSDQAFDIEAKLPEGTVKEQVNAMLQSMLEERFALKIHRDTRTQPGFALVIAKNGPRLQTAEQPPAGSPDLTPEQRQAQVRELSQARMAETSRRMQENRENGTPLTGFSRLTLRSVTCEGLASQLARIVEAPVQDATGLTGKYSVTIETWKNPDLPGGTIFDAVEKLGLRLEPRKVTAEIVVVDQVSKTPTAN